MGEWEEHLKSVGLKNEKENQELFYKRTKDFIKSDKKILINPAGMGLGKTFATSSIIKDYINNYNIIFIANPTMTIKYVWSKELYKLGLSDKKTIWISKKHCCIFKSIFKIKKFNFALDENKCNDDCVFRRNVNTNETFELECNDIHEYYSNLLKNKKEPRFPTPIEYYNLLTSKEEKDNIDLFIKENNVGYQNYNPNVFHCKSEECSNIFPHSCLRPVVLKTLSQKKIIIGDYFGIINQQMFINITKRNPAQMNSLLIIDEGHLIPLRFKSMNSKKINLLSHTKKLKRELDENITYITGMDNDNIQFFIDIITYKLVKKAKINFKFLNDSIEYHYNDLLRDLEINNQKMLAIMSSIETLFKVIKQRSDTDDSEKISSKDFIDYLNKLIEVSNNPNYHCSLKYGKYFKKDEYFLNVKCICPSDDIRKSFYPWDKIIINSGTIRDKKTYIDHLGVDKDEYIFEKYLKSFDISKDTFIIPYGNFSKPNRYKTYKNNNEKLCTVLKKIKGKTIIFIQSKENSNLLCHLLKENGIIIKNFCKNLEDDFDISSEEFEEIKEEFSNYDGECVGIININGRVEGHNFIDEMGDFILSNVIIYGYPLDYTDDFKRAELKFYSHRYNYDKAKKICYIYDSVDKIHQGCYRAKRDIECNPIIILWGERFGKDKKIFVDKDENNGWIILSSDNNVFSNLPDELKQNYGNFDDLIKFINQKHGINI